MSKKITSDQVIADVRKYIGKAQYAGLYGIALKSAIQNTITDVENNSYLDFLAAASSVTLGYGHDDLISAYADTAKKLAHSCFVYSPNLETIELAKKLVEITPGQFEKKVLFGVSASDSVDGAIKAARKFTGRMKIVAFHNAYHGNTGLSAQATGFPGIRNGFLESEHFYFLDFPTTEEEAAKCLQQTKELFQQHAIAGFLIEPIQGDGGNLVPPPTFFRELQKLTKENGVIFIDDETQSGVGRSGKWWAIEHFGVEPDILISGKGLSGGYASISACIGKKEIIDVLDKAQHVFTYSGHPPSSAVASKVLDIIKKDKILDQVEQKGKFLIEELEKICQKYATQITTEVRGRGFQIGLALKDKTHPSLAALFGCRCIEKGIYVGYFGKNNDVLRIHPPLTITTEEIKRFVSVIDEVFSEWVSNNISQSAFDRYHTHCLGLGEN